MEDKYIVYKYTSPSGKHYIGITKNEELRKSQHLSQSKYGPIFKWQKAINKYGFDNMKYEVLYRNLSKDEAMKKETESILEYDSLNNGYNCTNGGETIADNGFRYFMCDKNMNVLEVFNTQSEAAISSGITQSQISRLTLGLNEADSNGNMWFKVKVDDINSYVYDEYDEFKKFYSNMYLTIRRMCAYYNLTSEEMEQECAIVFFENEDILKSLRDGNNRESFRLFSLGLRRSLTDFSATGKQLRGAETKDRQVYKIQRMENIYEEEHTLEDEVMDKLEIERLRNTYGHEYIDDILEYYEIGADRYCHKHKISNTNARTRIYRKIQKLRNAEA